MNIAIPLGGQIRMVVCSSFVIAKRKDATHYDLSGESFQLTGVTADQVYVFDDSVVITEGNILTACAAAEGLQGGAAAEMLCCATCDDALRLLKEHDGAGSAHCRALAAAHALRLGELAVKGGHDLQIAAAIGKVQNAHALHLLAHPDAVAAEDALVGIPDDGRR